MIASAPHRPRIYVLELEFGAHEDPRRRAGRNGSRAPYAASRPLTIAEVDLAPPGPGEVLVKIAAAGLCHSDLSVIDGSRPRPTPMVLGHEASAIVVETGAGVDEFVKDDHAILVFVPNCGHCAPCSIGRPALCEPAAAANAAGALVSGARRLSRNGTPLHHHLGVAAFAEYATVSRRSLVKIDQDLPLNIAALFALCGADRRGRCPPLVIGS